MSSTMRTRLSRVTRALPTLATLTVLAGVGYLGHQLDWKIPPLADVLGTAPPKDGAWCVDHGVPEATCIVCRGFKVTSTPPSLLASLGLKAADPGTPAPPEPGDGKPLPPVQLPSAEMLALAGVETANAETRAVDEVIEANAESGYDMTRYAQVAPRVAGHAVAVRMQPGQRVRHGEVLVLIDATEVGKAKAEFLQAAATLASRRTILERVRSSTEAGFRNQADLVSAEADVNDASIRLFNARQALINLGLPAPEFAAGAVPAERDVQFLGLPANIVAGLDPAQTTANLLPVAAPLEGVVVWQRVVPGEVVEPAQPLLAVADTSRMWVTAEVSPGQVERVRIGQEMTFAPDSSDGAPFAGKVSWISTEVNEKTRTVQVRAEVANPDGRLLARAFGRATIAVRTSLGALVVPEVSVQPDGSRYLVFVRLNDEVFRPRAVTLGARCGGYVEVLTGLSAGETVATRGSHVLAAQANRGKLGAGCCAIEPG